MAKIMTPRERRDYLVARMAEGLEVLDTFFGTLSTKRDVNARELGEGLLRAHNLTESQRNYFVKTINRAERAQEIVRYFEGRYGLKDGAFEDAQGLYKATCPEEEVHEGLKARPFNIAIGFSIPNWKRKGSYGYTSSNQEVQSDQLDVPIKKTISDLSKGKKMRLEHICFCVPTKEFCEEIDIKFLSPRDHLIAAIFDEPRGGLAQSKIVRHELRHIFDNIMSEYWGLFEETAATLCTEDSRGLRIDYGNMLEFRKETARRREERLAKLASLNAPETVIDNAKMLVERGKVEDARIKDEFIALADLFKLESLQRVIKGSKGKGRDRIRQVSYLFSSPNYKIGRNPDKVGKDEGKGGKMARRFNLLADFYASQNGS
jgi:hypothetical protein